MGLSLLPLIVIAWYSKLKGGILFGLILFPLNSVLAFVSGGDWTVMIRGGAPGTIALVFSGGIVGKMSELSDKLKARNFELQRQQEITMEKENLRLRTETEKAIFIENVALGVGHFLRLPLGAIGSAADGVTRADDKGENNAVVQLIHKNLIWADRMIWNLWDFASEEELSKSEIELKSVVGNVLSKLVIPKGVTIRTGFEDGFKLNVDADKFERVIHNLLTNAIQAFRDGMEIAILAETKGDFAVMMITDSGKGILPKDKEMVLKPFFSTRMRGMGLGLTIAKKVIEVHGGSLHVQSEEFVGTRVTLKIPIKSKALVLLSSQVPH